MTTSTPGDGGIAAQPVPTAGSASAAPPPASLFAFSSTETVPVSTTGTTTTPTPTVEHGGKMFVGDGLAHDILPRTIAAAFPPDEEIVSVACGPDNVAGLTSNGEICILSKTAAEVSPPTITKWKCAWLQADESTAMKSAMSTLSPPPAQIVVAGEKVSGVWATLRLVYLLTTEGRVCSALWSSIKLHTTIMKQQVVTPESTLPFKLYKPTNLTNPAGDASSSDFKAVLLATSTKRISVVYHHAPSDKYQLISSIDIPDGKIASIMEINETLASKPLSIAASDMATTALFADGSICVWGCRTDVAKSYASFGPSTVPVPPNSFKVGAHVAISAEAGNKTDWSVENGIVCMGFAGGYPVIVGDQWTQAIKTGASPFILKQDDVALLSEQYNACLSEMSGRAVSVDETAEINASAQDSHGLKTQRDDSGSLSPLTVPVVAQTADSQSTSSSIAPSFPLVVIGFMPPPNKNTGTVLALYNRGDVEYASVLLDSFACPSRTTNGEDGTNAKLTVNSADIGQAVMTVPVSRLLSSSELPNPTALRLSGRPLKIVPLLRKHFNVAASASVQVLAFAPGWDGVHVIATTMDGSAKELHHLVVAFSEFQKTEQEHQEKPLILSATLLERTEFDGVAEPVMGEKRVVDTVAHRGREGWLRVFGTRAFWMGAGPAEVLVCIDTRRSTKDDYRAFNCDTLGNLSCVDVQPTDSFGGIAVAGMAVVKQQLLHAAKTGDFDLFVRELARCDGSSTNCRMAILQKTEEGNILHHVRTIEQLTYLGKHPVFRQYARELAIHRDVAGRMPLDCALSTDTGLAVALLTLLRKCDALSFASISESVARFANEILSPLVVHLPVHKAEPTGSVTKLNGPASLRTRGGRAVLKNGDSLVLVQKNQKSSMGSAMIECDVSNGFVAEFSFVAEGAADGFAFVVMSGMSNETAGAHAGNTLGYSNAIGSGIAVEFDFYCNSDIGDPEVDHISVQHNRITGVHTTSNHSASVGCAKLAGRRLADGLEHSAKIVMDVNGSLAVCLDGTALVCAERWLTVVPQALLRSALNSWGDFIGKPRVGFTAATGGLTSTITITKFSLEAGNTDMILFTNCAGRQVFHGHGVVNSTRVFCKLLMSCAVVGCVCQGKGTCAPEFGCQCGPCMAFTAPPAASVFKKTGLGETESLNSVPCDKIIAGDSRKDDSVRTPNSKGTTNATTKMSARSLRKSGKTTDVSPALGSFVFGSQENHTNTLFGAAAPQIPTFKFTMPSSTGAFGQTPVFGTSSASGTGAAPSPAFASGFAFGASTLPFGSPVAVDGSLTPFRFGSAAAETPVPLFGSPSTREASSGGGIEGGVPQTPAPAIASTVASKEISLVGWVSQNALSTHPHLQEFMLSAKVESLSLLTLVPAQLILDVRRSVCPGVQPPWQCPVYTEAARKLHGGDATFGPHTLIPLVALCGPAPCLLACRKLSGRTTVHATVMSLLSGDLADCAYDVVTTMAQQLSTAPAAALMEALVENALRLDGDSFCARAAAKVTLRGSMIAAVLESADVPELGRLVKTIIPAFKSVPGPIQDVLARLFQQSKAQAFVAVVSEAIAAGLSITMQSLCACIQAAPASDDILPAENADNPSSTAKSVHSEARRILLHTFSAKQEGPASPKHAVGECAEAAAMCVLTCRTCNVAVCNACAPHCHNTHELNYAVPGVGCKCKCSTVTGAILMGTPSLFSYLSCENASAMRDAIMALPMGEPASACDASVVSPLSQVDRDGRTPLLRAVFDHDWAYASRLVDMWKGQENRICNTTTGDSQGSTGLGALADNPTSHAEASALLTVDSKGNNFMHFVCVQTASSPLLSVKESYFPALGAFMEKIFAAVDIDQVKQGLRQRNAVGQTPLMAALLAAIELQANNAATNTRRSGDSASTPAAPVTPSLFLNTCSAFPIEDAVRETFHSADTISDSLCDVFCASLQNLSGNAVFKGRVIAAVHTLPEEQRTLVVRSAVRVFISFFLCNDASQNSPPDVLLRILRLSPSVALNALAEAARAVGHTVYSGFSMSDEQLNDSAEPSAALQAILHAHMAVPTLTPGSLLADTVGVDDALAKVSQSGRNNQTNNQRNTLGHIYFRIVKMACDFFVQNEAMSADIAGLLHARMSLAAAVTEAWTVAAQALACLELDLREGLRSPIVFRAQGCSLGDVLYGISRAWDGARGFASVRVPVHLAHIAHLADACHYVAQRSLSISALVGKLSFVPQHHAHHDRRTSGSNDTSEIEDVDQFFNRANSLSTRTKPTTLADRERASVLLLRNATVSGTPTDATLGSVVAAAPPTSYSGRRRTSRLLAAVEGDGSSAVPELTTGAFASWPLALTAIADAMATSGALQDPGTLTAAHVSMNARKTMLTNRVKKLVSKRSNASFRVTRQHIVMTSLSALKEASNPGTVSVAFANEAGSGPGVVRGWFTMFGKALIGDVPGDANATPASRSGLSTTTGSASTTGATPVPALRAPASDIFFVPSEVQGTFVPRTPLGVEWNTVREDAYKSIGVYLGMALLNNCVVPLVLVRPTLKYMIGRSLHMEDLAFYSPERYDALAKVLAMGAEELEAACLSFVIPHSDAEGGGTTDLLAPSGSDGGSVTVTQRNVREYVRLHAEALMVGSCKRELDALRTGFQSVIPPSTLSCASTIEFTMLLCGSQNVTGAELRAVCCIKNDSDSRPEAVQTEAWLWEIFNEMNSQQLAAFIYFSTGSPSIAPGITSITIAIGECCSRSADRRCRFGHCTHLPTAGVCSSSIQIAAYPSKDILREKILLASVHGTSYEFG